MKNKIILFVSGLILSVGIIQAELAVSLNVATAGNLSTLIDASEKYSITGLTLTGNLNGDDIRYIREMAGSDVNGKPSSGSLNALDLSGAKIVGGGRNYCIAFNKPYYTSNNLISDFMFYGCNKLNCVTLPGSVTTIKDYAFYYCTGLVSVTIPDGVTSVRDYAFQNCTGLTSVTLPGSVTILGVGVFNGCSGLSSVTIPGSVTSIGNGAFFNCTGLTSVTIPGSVTYLGHEAFSGCSGLTSVTIPGSVTSINSRAFFECTGLTTVNLSNGVKTIGISAFAGCTGLTTVTIPDSLSTMGNYAFGGCAGLIEIVADSNNSQFSSIDGVLFNKNMTSLVAYPGGRSGKYIIPGSVTSIENGAFFDCTGLTSVFIPSGVNYIGNSAFIGCTGLVGIHCQMITPPSISIDVFMSESKYSSRLYVPLGSIQSYMQAKVWKDFVNIVEDGINPVNEISLYKTSVSTLDNAIIIQNAHGETISIYTPSGALLRTVKATDNLIKIEVPENQIYLVRISNSTYKVALN